MQVQIDDDMRPWLPALLFDLGNGTFRWSFAWDLPDEDGTTHRVRVRARATGWRTRRRPGG